MHSLSPSKKNIAVTAICGLKSSSDAIDAGRFAVCKAAIYEWLQMAAILNFIPASPMAGIAAMPTYNGTVKDVCSSP